MIRRLTIPVINTNVIEVTVIRWLKKEGDTVRRGEPLAEMTTEKAAFDYESPCNGMLRRILTPERSVIPIGFCIALVGSPDDPLPEVSAHNAKLLARHRERPGIHATAGKTAPVPATAIPTANPNAVRATPAARRLAREQGIDLRKVQARFPGIIIDGAAIRRFQETDKP
ncbi:MAG: hypothetical protein A2498_13525 [Lentisphaerae bacterium RIFOXYC12_FULL_60_16]|nr:MAG: hypothetical protein A2498_13525 [Lentisphaerae bacterium RIFOXYC12_FULL_60_16]OGV83909.1 MAG: hypothetical protein A2340_08955 [Lentisphaerae bacterium RIFOXYB12_FULL_60_10]